MNLNFQNRFGHLSLRLVSDVMQVKDIHGKNFPDLQKFNIDTAEKIALITDNRGIQICPVKSADSWQCYVVVHETSSTAAVAEIADLVYTGSNPAREIQEARQW